MENITEIPKKWYISRNADNYKEVNEYFSNLPDLTKTPGRPYNWSDGVIGFPLLGGNSCYSSPSRHSFKENGYVEVSTEFFREYINKQEPSINIQYDIY